MQTLLSIGRHRTYMGSSVVGLALGATMTALPRYAKVESFANVAASAMNAMDIFATMDSIKYHPASVRSIYR